MLIQQGGFIRIISKEIPRVRKLAVKLGLQTNQTQKSWTKLLV